MVALFPPTNAIVTVAWLSQRVTGFTEAMVATRLPRKAVDWAATGFIQVTPITGVPDVDIPVRHPVVQVDCWAVKLDAEGNITNKPPVGRANVLAERVRIATEDGALYGARVTTPAGYENAIVLSAYPLTEPVEITDDPSGYARITLDLALDWVRVPPTEEKG